MNPITIPNPIPGETIIALSADIMMEAAGLVEQANAVEVSCPETLQTAEGLFLSVDDLAKRIHEERMTVTRQIDALKKAIIAAEEEATVPLITAKKRLGHSAKSYRDEIERQRLEAERLAREEAERKAREERERLEAERQAQIEEMERRRIESAKEAELFGVPVEEELPPPPPTVVAPVIEAQPVEAPDLGRSPVRTTTRKRLVVDDDSKIPFEIGGKRLWTRDDKAITALLRAGVEVPGCRLEAHEVIGRAGR